MVEFATLNGWSAINLHTPTQVAMECAMTGGSGMSHDRWLWNEPRKEYSQG